MTWLPPEYERTVTLQCEAEVGGERVVVGISMVEAVYNDPAARKAVEDTLRSNLMHEILKEWKPVIRVDRQ